MKIEDSRSHAERHVKERHFKEKQEAKKKLINLVFFIFQYSIPFLVIDILVFILLRKREINFFQAVHFVYITNFVLLPSVYLFFALLKICAYKFRKHMPYGVRNTWWINRINTRKTGVNLVLSLLLLSTFVYASFIEPNNIQVRNVEIRTNKVYDEVTILHISDIQSVHIGKYEQKVFEIIEHLNPDLILHTGDLLQTGLNAEMIKLARLFKQLRPKYGIYNVVGDTDSQMNWQKFHRLSGVKTLIDKNVLINDKKVKISILGLSLHKSRYRDKSLIEDWKCRSKKDEFTIVFGHAPDYISKILKLDIDMCLAGHTHGGQVNIPFWGPVVTFSRFPKKWSNGFIKIRNSHVNVSAGIGVERACNLPPIRFNCPPVMTLFALRPQKITTD